MGLTKLQQLELAEKERRIKRLLTEEGLDGICLFKFMSFSWFTGGGTNRVVTGSEAGCAIILIVNDKKYLIAPSNEIDRIMSEQVAQQGYEPVTFYWYQNPLDVIKQVAGNKILGTDLPKPNMRPVGNKLDRLRFSLTENEVLNAKEIAHICSEELANTCVNIKPGMTEYKIAALLGSKLIEKGVKPAVLLVGSDDRVNACRHPVPTNKYLEKYALISLVGEKNGIHITLSRSVYFGNLPAEIRERYRKVLQVDCEMIQNTLVGFDSSKPFNAGIKAYEETGYPNEWKCHHQGGAIGYAPREYRAGDGRVENILAKQMFGWNPTLQGTKSEETILTFEGKAPEILTSVPRWWPVTEIKAKNGAKLVRPLILEI